jgi:hypothetical protein
MLDTCHWRCRCPGIVLALTGTPPNLRPAANPIPARVPKPRNACLVRAVPCDCRPQRRLYPADPEGQPSIPNPVRGKESWLFAETRALGPAGRAHGFQRRAGILEFSLAEGLVADPAVRSAPYQLAPTPRCQGLQRLGAKTPASGDPGTVSCASPATEAIPGRRAHVLCGINDGLHGPSMNSSRLVASSGSQLAPVRRGMASPPPAPSNNDRCCTWPGGRERTGVFASERHSSLPCRNSSLRRPSLTLSACCGSASAFTTPPQLKLGSPPPQAGLRLSGCTALSWALPQAGLRLSWRTVLSWAPPFKQGSASLAHHPQLAPPLSRVPPLWAHHSTGHSPQIGLRLSGLRLSGLTTLSWSPPSGKALPL